MITTPPTSEADETTAELPRWSAAAGHRRTAIKMQPQLGAMARFWAVQPNCGRILIGDSPVPQPSKRSLDDRRLAAPDPRL